jgi:hypothetical protein
MSLRLTFDRLKRELAVLLDDAGRRIDFPRDFLPEDPPPEPNGAFYSNIGPGFGVNNHGTAAVIECSPTPARGTTNGIAWLGRAIPTRRGPIQVWRLTVNNEELEGDWIVPNQWIVRLGDVGKEP